MAQGAVKTKSKPVVQKKYVPTPPVFSHAPPENSANEYSRKAGPKPGARVIKPKKASLISQNKIKKKSAAGLVGQTEKLLAEKAGHLEMLKGGKKDKKETKKTK
jgi:hypothetical protein